MYRYLAILLTLLSFAACDSFFEKESVWPHNPERPELPPPRERRFVVDSIRYYFDYWSSKSTQLADETCVVIISNSLDQEWHDTPSPPQEPLYNYSYFSSEDPVMAQGRFAVQLPILFGPTDAGRNRPDYRRDVYPPSYRNLCLRPVQHQLLPHSLHRLAHRNNQQHPHYHRGHVGGRYHQRRLHDSHRVEAVVNTPWLLLPERRNPARLHSESCGVSSYLLTGSRSPVSAGTSNPQSSPILHQHAACDPCVSPW